MKLHTSQSSLQVLCSPQRMQHTDAHFQMDGWHNVKVKGLSQTDWQGHEIRKLRKKEKEDKNKQKPFCVVVGNQTYDPELIKTVYSVLQHVPLSSLSGYTTRSLHLSFIHPLVFSFLAKVIFLSCFCCLSTIFFLSGMWWPSEEAVSFGF